MLVGGVVVHHQVQLAAVGVGAGDLLEEGQELLVPVPRLARAPVTLPVAISSAANSVEVPCRR